MHIWQLKILVVVGALGGRFDHEATNIDVLHSFANVLHIVLLSEESSLTLLAPGYFAQDTYKLFIWRSPLWPYSSRCSIYLNYHNRATLELWVSNCTWIFLSSHLQICTSVVKVGKHSITFIIFQKHLGDDQVINCGDLSNICRWHPNGFWILNQHFNILESDILVTVQSDAYLLWTTEIRFEPWYLFRF